jgi:hypothetical protein
MSSTRTARPGSPLRQERWSSSFNKGLLANLVAKRCEQIEDAEGRAVVWFLQWLSWQPGGIAAHIGEIYPSEHLKENPAIDLEQELFAGCLSVELQPKNDPDLRLASIYRERWIKKHSGGVTTEIGRRVAEAIEYARATRCLVLVDGLPRIGKSFSARTFCERSAGMVRYVETPASNDDFSFFRAIAKSLGVASSLKMKAQEIRARVEETLQAGDLTVVLDEAHYCFDSYLRSSSLPVRINWIMTALVNCGVPVVLVTTPQFYKAQARVEKSTGWTSDQFIGRIGHVEKLPEQLSMPDLVAVAGAVFPEGDARSHRALAAYADLSKQHLSAITALANRARWLAKQDARKDASAADLGRAMRECVLPVEMELAKSLAAAKSRKPRKPRATFSPAPRDTGAGLCRVSDEMISSWRRGSTAPLAG